MSSNAKRIAVIVYDTLNEAMAAFYLASCYPVTHNVPLATNLATAQIILEELACQTGV